MSRGEEGEDEQVFQHTHKGISYLKKKSQQCAYTTPESS